MGYFGSVSLLASRCVYYGLYSNSLSVCIIQFDAVYHVYHHLNGVVVPMEIRLEVELDQEEEGEVQVEEEPIGMAMNRWFNSLGMGMWMEMYYRISWCDSLNMEVHTSICTL